MILQKMNTNKNQVMNSGGMILTVLIALMLIVSVLTGVNWFELGDFGFKTAMAYHGIIIPAWMMLILAYSNHSNYSVTIKNMAAAGAVAGSILTCAGSILIRPQEFSIATIIQVAGMTVAEITALMVIIESFFSRFKCKQKKTNTLIWWSVSIALIGISLSTPMGHLAGAAKDLGLKFPLIIRHAALLGIAPHELINGYVDSHSHQALASFLSAGFTMSLIKTDNKTDAAFLIGTIGLSIMIIATIAQIILYQYCAWFGWQPPTLLSKGPNGLPLDDFILVILNLGMLLLIPLFLEKDHNKSLRQYPPFVRRNMAFILVIYIVSVIFLGLFIEFHEQYFGYGVEKTAGFLNDKAFIRAHLLFAFMITPVLIGVLLNLSQSSLNRYERIIEWSVFTIITMGIVGVFAWTFFLDAVFLESAYAVTVIFLLALPVKAIWHELKV